MNNFITHQILVEDYQSAFNVFADKKKYNAIKVVFKFNDFKEKK